MYQNPETNNLYLEYALAWQKLGAELVIFTLGDTHEKKIIATRKFDVNKMNLTAGDWFGVAPTGNIAILDVDMHSQERGFDLLKRLEEELDLFEDAFSPFAYCKTPRNGLHIVLQFPENADGSSALTGKSFRKQVYGVENPELEFFHGDKFKVILPGAVRYDGDYEFTSAAKRFWDRTKKLLVFKLTAMQAAKLAAIMDVRGSRQLESKMLDYADPANWKKGIRHDMFKHWSVRLYDESNLEPFTLLVKNAVACGISHKQIENMTLFAKRVRDRKRITEFFNRADIHEVIWISNTQYNALGANDTNLFLYILKDILKIGIRKNNRSGFNEMKFVKESDAELADDFKLWTPYSDFAADRLSSIIRDGIKIAYRVDNEGNSVFSKFKSCSCLASYMNLAEGVEKVDPFIVWLESRPKWDGIVRLNSLLANCFNISVNKNLEFAEFVVRSVFVGAVIRAYHPGYKHDTMSVLVGPQGCGKSTFWRELMPHNEWFSDNLNLAADDKTRVEALLGRVIVECSEMHGSNRAEIEALKAFITRQRDRLRMAYAKYVSDHERRCILVGSTNSDTCLPNDPTGNRRFLIAEVSPHVDKSRSAMKDFLDEYRDQLWAEALHRVQVNDEKSYVPDDMEVIQMQINQNYYPGDELLEHRVAKSAKELEAKYATTPMDKRHGLTMEQIYQCVNEFAENQEIRPTRSEQRKIGDILQQYHGWKKEFRMIDGVRGMRWYPPVSPHF